ncbi:MAG: endopeptidase La [Oscillospiraceae bacterium]|nr:endopeptidase La [Oscillospiraceae bacterium]
MENEMNTPRRLDLPMLALRGLVLFPKMILHFDVGREKSIRALNAAMKSGQQIYLAAQKDIQTDDPQESDLYSVGVVAEVRQILKASGNTLKVLVEGVYRARTVELLEKEPYWTARVEEYPLKNPKIRNTLLSDALMRTIKELFEEYCYLTPKAPKEIVMNVFSSEDPAHLVEYIAANLPLRLEDKQKLLEENSLTRRLEEMASILENENSIMSLEKDIYDKVKESIDQNQREYFLREQMRIISDELGEGESVQDEAEEYRERIEKMKLTGEVYEKLMKEADRLSKMPPNSQESSVIRNYLDACLELPWNTSTRDKVDIAKAKASLERDHYGLAKVKERILELLAVRRLAPDIKGQIICLAGPPGVGKTSVAKSIAKAMGRKYARISLGGVRDESDIRGHRKTYIGAMPGRIINALRLAGTRNPLILLDEIDKLGNDYKGDPSSALLEVLDSEQNNAFRDHYIELPFDLSDVLFVTTANDVGSIPGPLLDRMELIELSSYTREEKFHIAKRHLAPKQIRRHGLSGKTFRLADTAIYSLVDHYTREAGVRNLEREIASLCRKAAKKIAAAESEKVTVSDRNIVEFLGPKKFLPEMIGKADEVGLVNGLAWTSVGGEMLQVEVAVLEGSGKLELTGSLGDVMKESARTAVSFIRSVARQYQVDPDFYKNKDIHIHFPEGATPKDGPSAGVTVCTALVSALSGCPVRREVAMTGEITLRGRVLAIGGLKEKTMAAYRAGIKTVIIPKENEADLAELDPVVRDALRFIPVEKADEVLKNALIMPCDGTAGRHRPTAEALVQKAEKDQETERVAQ